MVATSQSLASEVGLSVLGEGGNAADAAVAVAAVLNVTEPCSTGIGGDMFALYYDAGSREVSALNGSGRAPAGLTLERIATDGWSAQHAHTITVPGACAGWCDLLERHGSRSLAALLAPAIELAEAGFPVSPVTARSWSRSVGLLARAPGGAALLADGRAPDAGEVFCNPGLARTLREIGAGGAEVFYRGPIGRAICETVQRAGGVLGPADLFDHRSSWEEPICVPFGDAVVWECPPNGQGMAALMALNILSGYDLARLQPCGALRWHLMIESLRLAFSDARWYVADPSKTPVPVDALLSAEYAQSRRLLIDPERANPAVRRGTPWSPGGTVYFCTVDEWGNACSFINSNYMGFGTGIVPEGWGFSLQNRGHNFSLDPQHPNVVAPGKRPYHTIIPGMLTRRADGELLGPFGVMGGFMQPQGHLQVLLGVLIDGVDPQAALDRLRFCIDGGEAGGRVLIERGAASRLVEGLTARGHSLQCDIGGDRRVVFGRGQIILKEPDGTLVGGSDPRADGCALGR